MRALVPVGLLLLVTLAGCTTQQDSGPTFHLGGSFTADRTQADLDEFQGIVEDYSDDVAYLESYPEQFSIRGIVGGCEQLRATLQAKDYVASVSACVQESDGGGEPQGSTSSP